MNIDEVVAAHRPTPLPQDDVVGRHRSTLDRRIAAESTAESQPVRRSRNAPPAQIIHLDDPRNGDRSGHQRRSRRRLTTVAAAGVLVLAATVGTLSLRSEVDPPAAVDTAGAPTSTMAAPAATAMAVPTTSAAPVALGADALLLARLYTLLEVGTRTEAIAFFEEIAAEEANVADCMLAAGFQYTVMDPTEDVTRLPWYSMPADEFAARYGLGNSGAAGHLRLFDDLRDPAEDDLLNLTSAQRQAYNTAVGECRRSDPNSEAVRASNASELALEQFRELVPTDDRIVAATATWSACLAAAGFEYDSLQEMRNSFGTAAAYSTSRAQLEELFADEVVTAIANVPCQQVFDAAYRDVVLDRLGDFTRLYDTALASGATVDAAG